MSTSQKCAPKIQLKQALQASFNAVSKTVVLNGVDLSRVWVQGTVRSAAADCASLILTDGSGA